MKLRIKTWSFLAITFLIFIFLLLRCVRANPVVFIPTDEPVWIITTLIFSFLFTLFAEYGVIFGFYKPQKGSRKQFFFSVFLVNVVTFPVSQLLFYLILEVFKESFLITWTFIIIIEIGVVLGEWLLYLFEFKKLSRKLSMDGNFSLKRVLLATALANLASFITGFVILTILSYGHFPITYFLYWFS